MSKLEPSGWTAKRFTQKPLCQPSYDFRDVPKCSADLASSSIHFLTEREHLVEAMSEMVLLCIEAMRRQKCDGKKRSSKPLSLEYMADRLDVDDPICGYLVRTKEKPESGDVSSDWEVGMLQGFITFTTFTNWQKTFRWDSMHDSAFAYDDEHLAEQMASGKRRYDHDGSLAKALQATVRSGDPWDEGIVWPRIAEISLLGGLGCGKVLLSLAIEHLENLKATGKANYDYVVLQATDNSIPFYESMGFVRVGAITEDEKFAERQTVRVCETSSHSSSAETDAVAEPLDESTSERQGSPPLTPEIVSSRTFPYTTEKPGETIKDIARRFQVDPWDTVFLNQIVYDGLTPSSRLIKGTILRIPCSSTDGKEETVNAVCNEENNTPEWYIARENDTPRIISKRFNVNCNELVEANKGRLPELLAVSRLKQGTRIKVSHFHVHDDMHVPYCHWTFPDDDFDGGEPSYMMVLKLNRRQNCSSKERPVESFLAVPISPYAPARLLMPEAPAALNHNKIIPKQVHPKPKRPPSAFMLFVAKQRESRKEEFGKTRLTEISKVLAVEWKNLPESEKALFNSEFEKARSKYLEEKEQHARLMAEVAAVNPQFAPTESEDRNSLDLFNKVVRLDSGALRDQSEYTYWYVLTFIPDLNWCHLGPLYSDGTFGPDKPKSEGRTKWRLVDEKLGKELDISASFCIPVKSKALKKTQDADKEEWDIIDPDPSSGCVNLRSRLERPIRSSPRRKFELSETFGERRPNETLPKSLKAELLSSISSPPIISSSSETSQRQQLCKNVFSSKRARKGGLPAQECAGQGNRKNGPALAASTAMNPRSLVVRVTMSSGHPSSKRKASDLFWEEPLVAFCAGHGIGWHELASDAVNFTPATFSNVCQALEQEGEKSETGVMAGQSNEVVELCVSSGGRPKRKAAPIFLGESPSGSLEFPLNRQAPRLRAAIKPMGGMVKKKTKRLFDSSVCQRIGTEDSSVTRQEAPDEVLCVEKRLACTSVIVDQQSRTRHTIKNVGGRRSL